MDSNEAVLSQRLLPLIVLLLATEAIIVACKHAAIETTVLSEASLKVGCCFNEGEKGCKGTVLGIWIRTQHTRCSQGDSSPLWVS